MRHAEAKLWQSVKAKMRKPCDRLDRIENGISSGAPDVNGCLSGEDVWMELKSPQRTPKRATTALMNCAGNHPLLQTQINWFARQRQASGIAFILVRTEHHLILVDGTKHCDHFNSWPLTTMISEAIVSFPVPTSADQWRLLRNVIFTASRYRRIHQYEQDQKLFDDLERREVDGDSRKRLRRLAR